MTRIVVVYSKIRGRRIVMGRMIGAVSNGGLLVSLKLSLSELLFTAYSPWLHVQWHKNRHLTVCGKLARLADM